ncbi:MAG TPA: glucoamylase family protein [Bryobacteraceae bacterium]|nr:glucoamylase family protein [Bryobacteraceae bacterium]
MNDLRKRWRELSRRTQSLALGDGRRLVQASLADTRKLEGLSLSVAGEYLDRVTNRFDPESLLEFLDRSKPLSMTELWALKPALQFVLLERMVQAPPEPLEETIGSLRKIAQCEWKVIFEAASHAERLLLNDEVYARMDAESREFYRQEVSHLAKYSGHGELDVIQAALDSAAGTLAASSLWQERATHVGCHLIAEGRAALEAKIGYRGPLVARVRRLLRKHPNGFFLIGIELATFLIAIIALSGINSITPIFAGFLLLLLPATQSAVELMNHLVTFVLRPCRLPKLDFSRGVPLELSTLVAVPVLLLSERQVRELVDDLEVRFLANRDPNIFFALLSDLPDSDQRLDENDDLVDLTRTLIRGLNERYGGGFYLLHRHRVYYESELAWLGWERKRGKLLDLNKLLRHQYDSFPVKEGDTRVLDRIRYVLCLDADTQLPPGAAQRLIGAIAHPLNRAIVDPATNMVVEGYGILQPRIGVSVQSASRSHLANILSGQTGFDIYTRAVSDVYQDLYREGSFTGKGIYEVDVLRQVLERRFPRSALLSHDLIEGAYARAGLVSDVELIDDYPSHYSAFSRRKHRWMRGDWQIVTWLFERAPDDTGRRVNNPISLISRWKILDNLRRSLMEPATFALLLAGWFGLAGGASYWTAVSLMLLLLPVYFQALFSLLRVLRSPSRTALKDMLEQTAVAHFNVMLELIFLAHQALVGLDAIVRSNVRRLITRKHMLEWETAAEAEAGQAKRTPVDTYLRAMPLVSLVIAALLYFFNRPALVMWPFLLLWALSGAVAKWLNSPPKAADTEIGEEDKKFLREAARLTWEYFREFSNAESNYLIPDNVQETPSRVAHRISPTNLGLLLNARLAALDLGLISREEFIELTEATFATMQKMAKFRGHFYNWYNTQTLEPLEPLFLSSVDSGNLAGALWALKQGCRELEGRELEGRELEGEAPRLAALAADADSFVADMDFSALFDAKRKLMSIGYQVSTGRLEPSVYDLLASESRLGCFVAVAKGDIPQESWFRLGRAQVSYRGEQLLLSWTGTMFEYLMPALWMRSFPGTLIYRSLKGAVNAQRKFAARRNVPWGISEAAYAYRDSEGNYQYQAFGVPGAAMKASMAQALVISPYSSFLALAVDPMAAIANLHRLWNMHWHGPYGFYESADYSAAALAGRRGEYELVRCWMAHHQGMTLLSIVNLLCENAMQRRFHKEPRVLATELILHEKALPVHAQPAEEEADLDAPLLQPASFA